MIDFNTATGPELAAWAAEHVMGWAGSSRAPSGWHPDTDWNDARRVLLAAGLKSSFVTATYFTIGSIMDDPDKTPLDLLRYVCEQSEAAAGREAKWKQAHRESEQAMDDLTR